MSVGRSRAPSSDRWLWGSLPRLLLPSRREFRQPTQRAQTGGEAVFAAAGDDERRQFLQAAADRPLRDREAGGSFVRSDEGILLCRRADEDAVVEPLRLDELELALQVRPRKHEDDPAILAVVLEHPLGKHR